MALVNWKHRIDAFYLNYHHCGHGSRYIVDLKNCLRWTWWRILLVQECCHCLMVSNPQSNDPTVEPRWVAETRRCWQVAAFSSSPQADMFIVSVARCCQCHFGFLWVSFFLILGFCRKILRYFEHRLVWFGSSAHLWVCRLFCLPWFCPC